MGWFGAQRSGAVVDGIDVPRTRRITPVGTVQHVIARFARGEFLMDRPGARRQYLDRLGRALVRSDAQCFGYSLMSNHVHLAMIAGETPLGSIFRSVHTGFATWLKGLGHGLGAVFAGRFRSITIAVRFTGFLLPYVHNNETRARVVPDVARSKWSSHPFYTGTEPAPAWLDVELGLRLCGFDATPCGRDAFDRWCDERLHRERRPELSDPIREAKRRGLLEQLPRGSEVSTPRVDGDGRPGWIVVQPAPRPTPAVWRGEVDVVIAAVAHACGIDAARVRSASREHCSVRARDAVLLAWGEFLGRPQVEMARALGLSEPAASRAAARARNDDALVRLAFDVAQTCRRQRSAA